MTLVRGQNQKIKMRDLTFYVIVPFLDNRSGFPVYLMQCASGQNWKEKVSEPNIDWWQQLIKFVVRPKKAFAIPFALSDDDFRRQCVRVQGLFLDRYRLLTAARYHEKWVSSSLKDQSYRMGNAKSQSITA